jgi:uncharacterized protein YbaA (DUF1428 family)
MPRYVDGFVIPVAKRNLARYRRLAKRCSKIWREHGALEYRECVGDDLAVKFGIPFPRLAKLRRGETVVFSWIVYRSRAHRDRANAKIMADPRVAKLIGASSQAFDCGRMSCGGFEVLVEA